MILLVDLCYRKDSLSADEFVKPIAQIVRSEGIPSVHLHFSEVTAQDIERADGAILCGTALMDNEFARHTDRFLWLRDCRRPVLGICAGMLVIALVYGCSTGRCREIGMTDIRRVAGDPLFAGKDAFQAYELHSLAVRPSDAFDVIAVSSRCVQAIRHRSVSIYGVMFHPEVRNEWVVRRFVRAHATPIRSG